MIKQLPNPEVGWKRYDDKFIGFKYNKLSRINCEGYYGDSYMIGVDNPSITFFAYTDKIRIISDIYEYSNRSNNIAIYIDDKEYRINSHSSFLIKMAVIFEKLDLELKVHKIEIKIDNKTNPNLGYESNTMTFDAVDICAEGKILKDGPCCINSDGTYYSFNIKNYNRETHTFKEISVLDIINETENALDYPENLFTSYTIGEETFKPIDKFNGDVIKLISCLNKDIKVIHEPVSSIVSQKNNFNTNIGNINKFILYNSKSVKVLVSTDNTTLKTFDTASESWTTLTDINVSDLIDATTNTKEIFNNKGIDGTKVSSLDFSSILITGTIKFFVLLINKDSIVKNISCSYTGGNIEQIVKDTDIQIQKYNGYIKIIPKIYTDKMTITIVPYSDGTGEPVKEPTDLEIQNMINNIFN